MQKILLIEDEPSIADSISYALEAEHFTVIWKSLGNEGIAAIKQESLSIVILDVGLPDMSGFDVCKQVRTFSEVPIIFLTARKEEIDRVVGFEIGGDDYVVKPFSPRELVGRVKAILKRSGNSTAVPNETGMFVVEEEAGRIRYGERLLELTRYEYGLLKCLLGRPGRIFSREQLMEAVWEAPEASMDRTVDAHIKLLRAKLRDAGVSSDLIKTHRGMGYSLELNEN